jgi:hypothetical protein
MRQVRTNVPEDQALKEAVHVLQARLEKYRIQNREVPKAPSTSCTATSDVDP